jgi:hypothetical protein
MAWMRLCQLILSNHPILAPCLFREAEDWQVLSTRCSPKSHRLPESEDSLSLCGAIPIFRGGSRGKTKAMKQPTRQIPLVVTTEHKGVFFGYGVPTKEKIIRIERVQMCVYWSADVKSVVGLAATGPSKTCRVGPPAPAMTLQDVTGIIEASPEAEKAWKEQPWS